MSDSNNLNDIFAVSSSALRAQDMRMKIIAENIANANTTPSVAGQKPYQRQIISFKNEIDKATGVSIVKVNGIKPDTSDFIKKYDPSNPAADSQGYIQTPNVNPMIEMMDMSDANRAYEANLNVIDSTRGMVLRTINLLQ